MPRARVFANEGVGRRLPLVRRCATNIFKTYPPNKTALLTRDECEDIGIQLCAFAINVYAIFDNIAWVCMLEAGGNLSPMKVSAFKLIASTVPLTPCISCQSFPPSLPNSLRSPFYISLPFLSVQRTISPSTHWTCTHTTLSIASTDSI